MRSNKKGDVWVSAILYLALGLVIIGIIIGVASPIVSQIRDRNIYAQTKTLMLSLDENINSVVNEGPGSRRFLSVFSVERGSLDVDEVTETITWEFDTDAELVEPGVVFIEGPLNIDLRETAVKDEFVMRINISYGDSVDLDLSNSTLGSPFQGTFSVTMEHVGFNPGGVGPTITFSAR